MSYASSAGAKGKKSAVYKHVEEKAQHKQFGTCLD